MFSAIFIRRPRFALVISIFIMLGGILCLNRLPIAEYPEITPPSIMVFANYAGAGAQDVLAVTWETKKDDFSFMAEGIAGLNVYNGGAGAQNVYGLVMMPSYRLSPHWEAVARYQLAGGSNAVVSDSRYYTTNSDYAKNCDLQQGFYFGANYYVCPDNPHQMKLMFGAEYLNSHGKDAKGNKGYTGWQISAGARFDF